MSLKCQIFYEEIIVFLILSENDNKIMCQKTTIFFITLYYSMKIYRMIMMKNIFMIAEFWLKL